MRRSHLIFSRFWFEDRHFLQLIANFSISSAILVSLENFHGLVCFKMETSTSSSDATWSVHVGRLLQNIRLVNKFKLLLNSDSRRLCVPLFWLQNKPGIHPQSALFDVETWLTPLRCKPKHCFKTISMVVNHIQLDLHCNNNLHVLVQPLPSQSAQANSAPLQAMHHITKQHNACTLLTTATQSCTFDMI